MKVGILGLGLIGGSLARAYALEGHTVYAIQRSEPMLSFAMLSGAVVIVVIRLLASHYRWSLPKPGSRS